MEVKIITGFPRGHTYGIRQEQSSSTSFVAASGVKRIGAPANERATDFAISSSRQRSPPRRCPGSERSREIVASRSAAESDEAICGMASILKVFCPNGSSANPIAVSASIAAASRE